MRSEVEGPHLGARLPKHRHYVLAVIQHPLQPPFSLTPTEYPMAPSL